MIITHPFLRQTSFRRVLEIWMEQWCNLRMPSTQSQLCIPQRESPGLTEPPSELRSRHNQQIKDKLSGKDWGFGERTRAPSSQLETVSHLSETHHTHPSDVLTLPTDRPRLRKGREKRRRRRRRGAVGKEISSIPAARALKPCPNVNEVFKNLPEECSVKSSPPQWQTLLYLSERGR